MAKQTKCFELEQEHIDIVEQVAKENGDSSASAALRFIIDDWHNSARVQAAQMAQFRERIAKTPGLVLVEAEQEATQ